MVKLMLKFEKGGKEVELISTKEDMDTIQFDILKELINESLRRHYSTKWRAGYTGIVTIADLLSHSPDKGAKAIAYTVQLSEEDFLYLASCKDATERHQYLVSSLEDRKILRESKQN